MGLFVLKDQDTLVPMEAAEFVREDEFQQLLARFPALLSGDRGDGKSPKRWLLIKREKSIPAEEGGSGRWAVDHLFIDDEGMPTLVEVKRQTDTRIRREVVGQMLDYAANAVVYWPAEHLQAEFEARCNTSNLDTEEELLNQLGIADADKFWQRVKANLQDGRIRMLFVADRIPPELRRIVEFLNQQMTKSEVLALELQQFAGEGLKTIVPVLYGSTEEAESVKGRARLKRQWDEESFFADLAGRHSAETCGVAQKIYSWMKSSGDVAFGHGEKDGSAMLMIAAGNRSICPMSIWTYGRVEIEFQYLLKGPFESDEKRHELLARLNQIEGVNLPADSITRRPTFTISTLSGERVSAFLSVMGWVVRELREAGEL
jgi:hypothetical protein